jgi:ankyrin repeat protein
LFGGEIALKARNFTKLHLFILGLCSDWEEEPFLDMIDAIDTEGRTALVWAIHRRDEKNVSMLLRKGANPNTVDCHSLTPLHFAIGYEAYDLIKPLLLAGADLNHSTKDGKTPLIQLAQCTRPGTAISVASKSSPSQAAQNSKLLTDIVVDLLCRGADMELKEEYGRSPLLLAVRWNNCIVTDLLLNAGADPTVIDFRRWTILHYAASTGEVETLQIITRYELKGVNKEHRSSDGMTATEMAQARDDLCSEWWVAFHELLSSMVEIAEANDGLQERGDEVEEEDEEDIFYDTIDVY